MGGGTWAEISADVQNHAVAERRGAERPALCIDKATEGKISLSEYKDAKGEMRPMYALTKNECLYAGGNFC